MLKECPGRGAFPRYTSLLSGIHRTNQSERNVSLWAKLNKAMLLLKVPIRTEERHLPGYMHQHKSNKCTRKLIRDLRVQKSVQGTAHMFSYTLGGSRPYTHISSRIRLVHHGLIRRYVLVDAWWITALYAYMFSYTLGGSRPYTHICSRIRLADHGFIRLVFCVSAPGE
jgi:hypothetical protein